MYFTYTMSQQQVGAGSTPQVSSRILIALAVVTGFLFCIRFAEHSNVSTVIVSAINRANYANARMFGESVPMLDKASYVRATMTDQRLLAALVLGNEHGVIDS